jgi:hypothetical protein
MKKLFVVSFILFAFLAIAALEPSQPGEESGFTPTHILRLIQPGDNEPVDVKMRLYSEGDKKIISNIMPDGQLMETEYVISEDNKIKYQWASIRNDMVVVVQSVGSRLDDGSFEGKYVALVDGQLREDMSGRFTLRKIDSTK